MPGACFKPSQGFFNHQRDKINSMDEPVIDDLLSSRLTRLLSEYPVVSAYLYSSAARGQMTPFSDVDIALVVAEDSVSILDRLQFELEIEEKIDRLCGIGSADVHVINDAPIMVRGEVIISGLLLFCQDEVSRVEFETRTYSEYFDFLPIAVSLREARLDRIYERGLNG